MAKIYHDGTNLLGLRKNDSEESLYPVPNGVTEIEFDESQNESLIQGLDEDWNAHSISGGVLQRDGSPVTINPESEDYAAQRAIRRQAGTAITQLQQIIDNADTATTAQLRQALKTEAEILQKVVRVLAKHLMES